MPIRIALLFMAAALAVPAALSAAPPVVLVQAGHLSPGEPGYLAQTGASGNPFGAESEFNRRVRDDMVTRLRAAGVDARPQGARVDPLRVGGATFISVHHDSPGGVAAVGRAVAGRGENWYHGQGFGTASPVPYSDSASHRSPTTVSARVEGTSTALAHRVSTALGGIHTSANGARARFLGVVPRGSNPRMNHFYGYYRTTAQARVLVEVGAAPDDNRFLSKVGLIGGALSDAIVADLRARRLL
ncbi:MAG: hypothetical protein EXQ74_00430 [Thermoleophilia bacterium]|nr:hypothetical protein [Thermoleophilia bacterium]